MLITSTKTPVIEKMEELCAVLLQQPMFRDIKSSMDAFMADEAAQNQYQGLLDKQDLLQGKQQRGLSLTTEEIDDFEQERESLFANDTIRKFIESQNQVQKLHDTLNKYLGKTIELGRVPAEEDLVSKGGGCCGGGGGGGGCGCHH